MIIPHNHAPEEDCGEHCPAAEFATLRSRVSELERNLREEREVHIECRRQADALREGIVTRLHEVADEFRHAAHDAPTGKENAL